MSKNNIPKVSVVVPVYNAEKYLCRCIDSLLNQTLENIEIIAADDCSSDSSLQILREYQKKYPDKLKVIAKTENGGPGGGRNACLSAATGEYIGFVDSDDYVDTDMFKKMYETAKRYNYDFVDCGCYCEAENKYILSSLTDDLIGTIDENKRKLMFSNIYLSGWLWTKLIKRNIIIDNNLLFRENVAFEDEDYILLLFYYSKNIGKVDEYLYYYKNNEDSIMNSFKIDIPKQIYNYSELFKAIIQRFKNIGAYNTYKEELDFNIFLTYSKLLRSISLIVIACEIENFDINFDINWLKNLKNLMFELGCDCTNNIYAKELALDPDIKLAYTNNNDYTKTIDFAKSLFL